MCSPAVEASKISHAHRFRPDTSKHRNKLKSQELSIVPHVQKASTGVPYMIMTTWTISASYLPFIVNTPHRLQVQSICLAYNIGYNVPSVVFETGAVNDYIGGDVTSV